MSAETTAAPQTGAWLRASAWLAFALLVVIALASGFLRLAQGDAALAGAIDFVRAMHRVAATTAAIVIVVIATLGWDRFQPLAPARGVMAAQLALALALAWTGVYTPSDHAFVTFANPLGGLAMVGLAWWLCLAPRARTRVVPAAALALLAIAATVAIVLWPPGIVAGLALHVVATVALIFAVTLVR
jgi:hypothetical protein